MMEPVTAATFMIQGCVWLIALIHLSTTLTVSVCALKDGLVATVK